jgi:hypothetical protein
MVFLIDFAGYKAGEAISKVPKDVVPELIGRGIIGDLPKVVKETKTRKTK